MKRKFRHFLKKLKAFSKIYKQSLILFLAGLALLGLGLSLSRINFGAKEPSFIRSEQSTDQIKVDVSGAVKNPGIYSLNSSDRVSDAISKAGGLTVEADNSWVQKNLNLASKLTDGQKIYIPKVGEAALSAESNKISINTASEKELDTLPGVGPVTAQKIISNRPYGTLEDLLKKKVVGEATFEKIKEEISL